MATEKKHYWKIAAAKAYYHPQLEEVTESSTQPVLLLLSSSSSVPLWLAVAMEGAVEKGLAAQ